MVTDAGTLSALIQSHLSAGLRLNLSKAGLFLSLCTPPFPADTRAHRSGCVLSAKCKVLYGAKQPCHEPKKWANRGTKCLTVFLLYRWVSPREPPRDLFLFYKQSFAPSEPLQKQLKQSRNVILVWRWELCYIICKGLNGNKRKHKQKTLILLYLAASHKQRVLENVAVLLSHPIPRCMWLCRGVRVPHLKDKRLLGGRVDPK